MTSRGDRIASEWATGNRNGTRKHVLVPRDAVVIGMLAGEQRGYGVVDLALCYRHWNRIGHSEPVCRNRNAQRHYEQSAPQGGRVIGVLVKEQRGYGVVDVRFVYD